MTQEEMQRRIIKLEAMVDALLRARADDDGGDDEARDIPRRPRFAAGTGIGVDDTPGEVRISLLGGAGDGGAPMPLDLSSKNGFVYARNGGFTVRVGAHTASPNSLDASADPWQIASHQFTGRTVYLAVWRRADEQYESLAWRWDLLTDSSDAPSGAFVIDVGSVSRQGKVTQRFHGNLLVVAPKSKEMTMVENVYYDDTRHAFIGLRRKWSQVAGQVVPVEQQDRRVTSVTDPDTGAVTGADIEYLEDGSGNPVMTTGAVPFIAAQFVEENY